MRIESERLYLRPFNESDAEHIWQLHSDPEVMQYTRKQRALTRQESHLDLIGKTIKNKVWAAFAKDDSFIGWFGIWTSDEFGGEPELGFMILKSLWGKGYSTEAAKALMNHTKHPKLHAVTVHAVTVHANIGSQRVLEKLGFLLIEQDEVLKHYLKENK
jgi:RimJ/RimL family protein N-acetyltransferase